MMCLKWSQRDHFNLLPNATSYFLTYLFCRQDISISLLLYYFYRQDMLIQLPLVTGSAYKLPQLLNILMWNNVFPPSPNKILCRKGFVQSSTLCWQMLAGLAIYNHLSSCIGGRDHFNVCSQAHSTVYPKSITAYLKFKTSRIADIIDLIKDINHCLTRCAYSILNLII